jgi:hypothetical protein
MKRQEGFAHSWLLLLLLLIFGVLGFSAYRVYTLNKPAQKQEQTSDTASEEKVPGLKYTDEVAKFTITYPPTWKINTEKGDQFGDGESPTRITTLTAPSGLTLSFDVNYGGRGGDCQANVGDTPHNPQNACPTFEILSEEDTNNTLVSRELVPSSQGSDELVLKDINRKIKLIRVKYTNGSETMYFSSLSQYDSELRKPVMGASVNFTILDWLSKDRSIAPLDIHMRPQGTSVDFFSRDDVKEAEGILRSLNFQ